MAYEPLQREAETTGPEAATRRADAGQLSADYELPPPGTVRQPMPGIAQIAAGMERKELTDSDPRFVDVAPNAVPNAPPIVDARDRRQRQAGFEQLARSHTHERTAPTNIEIPESLDKALDTAWSDSLATKKEEEEGGNVVRTLGGDYKLRRGHDHTNGSFTPDPNDIGLGQTYVGVAHTHPYRDEEAAHQMSSDWGTFSEWDLANMCYENEPIKILRSTPYTYVVSRTKEFDALVAQAGEDESDHSRLYQPMIDTFQAAHGSYEGPFADKLEAGVIAVCKAYHLVYYEGSGRELHRRSERP
jgi:hypothetical protein